MSGHILFEVKFWALSLAAGGWLMAVYDGLRLLRLAVSHSGILRGAEDFLYWIYAGILTFSLLLSQNDGMPRAYAVAGVLAGMAVYDRFVSRILFRLLKKTIKYFKIKRRTGR